MKRFIAIFMVLCLVFGLSCVSTWADTVATWQKETTMDTARQRSASCIIGNNIYVLGGELNSRPLNNLDIYNVVSGKWTTGQPLPEANELFAATAVGNKIYVFGGKTEKGATNSVRIYDTKTDTWTSGNPMPTARYFATSSLVNNKIYVIGGANQMDSNFTKVLEIYDIATDTWTTGKPMPTPRVSQTSVAVGDKIYTFGGSDTLKAINVVEIYNTKDDTWNTGQPVPTNRSAMTATLVGDKIYTIGGALANTRYSIVEIYDPQSNTWSKGPSLIEARCKADSVVGNGKLYVIGGQSATGELASVESLQVGTVEQNKVLLSVLLNEGEDVQLSTSFNLDNNKNYTWSSTNEAVAKVDANGKVTAVAEGNADIYAQNADGTFKEYIPVKVVAMADELRLAVHLKLGEKAKLYLTDDASQVTWSSMDSSIATVAADGRVTGVKKGLAIVKAELDGQAYQIYVRVNG